MVMGTKPGKSFATSADPALRRRISLCPPSGGMKKPKLHYPGKTGNGNECLFIAALEER
jgi:hypothetical protein